VVPRTGSDLPSEHHLVPFPPARGPADACRRPCHRKDTADPDGASAVRLRAGVNKVSIGSEAVYALRDSLRSSLSLRRMEETEGRVVVVVVVGKK
jgi:hypothetical protein